MMRPCVRTSDHRLPLSRCRLIRQMLKRSADELAHQCESGDAGGCAEVASRDGEGPTKDLHPCRSCGSERNVGGGRQRGGGSSSPNSVVSKRPGTAPATVRRCPRGTSMAGRAGNDGNSAKSGKQPVFANLMMTADNPCAHPSSGSGYPSPPPPSPRPCSSGCRRGCARSNQPAGKIGGASPRGTGRRAQTAARTRSGGVASTDNSNAGGCSCFSGGGVKKHPAKRAQTAGRCRLRSAGDSRCSSPAAVTPPPHPRRSPRGGDGIGEHRSRDGGAEETGGTGFGVGRHPQRAAGAETAAAGDTTSCCYRQQRRTEGGRGEEAEALLAKRSTQSRSTDETKRQSPDGNRGTNSGRRAHDPGAAGHSAAPPPPVTTVETGLTRDTPPEQGEKGVEKESSTATADGMAVQV